LGALDTDDFAVAEEDHPEANVSTLRELFDVDGELDGLKEAHG
jgi:hypothetical protein